MDLYIGPEEGRKRKDCVPGKYVLGDPQHGVGEVPWQAQPQ